MKYTLPKRFSLNQKEKEEAEGFYRIIIWFGIGLLIGSVFLFIIKWLTQ